MALSFTLDTTDKVLVDNPHTLGAGSETTLIQWVRKNVNEGTTLDGNGLCARNGGYDGLAYYDKWFSEVGRATTRSDAVVTAANMGLVLNEWSMVCTTYSEADGVRIFKGDLTNPPTERTYYSRLAGAGDTTANTNQLIIGNRSDVNPKALPFDIAAVHYIAKRLTLAELQQQWMRLTKTADTRVLHHYYNSATDYSGESAEGVITGATFVDHVPLPAPFSFSGELLLRKATRAIAASTGNLTLTGQTATVAADNVIIANTATLALTGQTSTVAADNVIIANTATLALTGQTSTVAADNVIIANTATLALTGQAAAVSIGAAIIEIVATTSVLTLTGKTATIAADNAVVTATSALTISAQNAAVSTGNAITANTQMLSITGAIAALNLSTGVLANTTSISLVGYKADVNAATNISAGSTSVLLVEQSANVNASTKITAITEFLNLSPKTAAVKANVVIQAATADILISAYPASIILEQSVSLFINTTQATLIIAGQPVYIISGGVGKINNPSIQVVTTPRGVEISKTTRHSIEFAE